MGGGKIVITLKNVSKIYEQGGNKIEAVRNVNLHILSGEIFGIIGYSGAGKSSLLRCINLLEKPASGSVEINKIDMLSLNDVGLRNARRKIGMIFQHFNLLSSSTVFANVAAPLQLVNIPKKIIKEKVSELLALVGLEDKVNHYPAQLSGGQKQRVAIARALANEPEILLCDEATSALDPQTTDSILELLLDINRKLNITIVLITHEMHVIKKICDRVAVMENGSIIEEGPVIDVFINPQTETTKKFIHNVLDIQLPKGLFQKLRSEKDTSEIIQVSFEGEAVTEPILAELVTRFSLKPSIIFGNITEIKDTIFGSLIVKVSGEPKEIKEGLLFLNNQGLRTEVIHHAY